MKHVMVAVVMVMGMSLVGCAALKESVGSFGGLFGIGQNKIEAMLAAEVAGTYTVQITKDGAVLLSESWECTKHPESGKLTGCHKR